MKPARTALPPSGNHSSPTVSPGDDFADLRLIVSRAGLMTGIWRLPQPVTENWDWQLKGTCRGMASTFFFHPEGERGHTRADRVSKAKEICQNCPVLTQCRAHALVAQELYGVWGGLSETDRRSAAQQAGT